MSEAVESTEIDRLRNELDDLSTAKRVAAITEVRKLGGGEAVVLLSDRIQREWDGNVMQAALHALADIAIAEPNTPTAQQAIRELRNGMCSTLTLGATGELIRVGPAAMPLIVEAAGNFNDLGWEELDRAAIQIMMACSPSELQQIERSLSDRTLTEAWRNRPKGECTVGSWMKAVDVQKARRSHSAAVQEAFKPTALAGGTPAKGIRLALSK